MKFKVWATAKVLGDLLETTTDTRDEYTPGDRTDVKKGKIKRLEARAKLNAQLLSGMMLRLADSELQLALEAKSAKELWGRIAEVYSKGGAQAEKIKMRELVSLRLSDGGSVVHPVGQFKSLA